MSHQNVEIKAYCSNQDKIRVILLERNADFKGTDHQIDTYFKSNNGKLKLREGNIENYLIFYEREEKAGPKESKVTLYKNEPGSNLKQILEKSIGNLVTVDKNREIYFIDNIKFHLDVVEGLGTFVEIEARDPDGTIGLERLQDQCREYLSLFEISTEDLLEVSYSDLLLKRQ
jgi:predicted adenylyl cyclase CyaB